MTDNVVPFAKPEPLDPYNAGPAKCIECKHRWVQVAPVGMAEFECPACGSMKGVFTGLVGAQEGDLGFSCACGCDVLTAYKRAGRFYLRCMRCGTDQTEAIFG